MFAPGLKNGTTTLTSSIAADTSVPSMVEVAALSIGDAERELDRIAAAAGVRPTKDDLLLVQQTLVAATSETEPPPFSLLAVAVGLASTAEAAVVDALPTRAKVVMRLLRSGAVDAAWMVLIDAATGVVRREFHGSTSSGADRADWALPLLTCVEAPNVYVELPGFRDPRYGAPDEAYEVGSAIKLRSHVDELVVGSPHRIGGWAALEIGRAHV